MTTFFSRHVYACQISEKILSREQTNTKSIMNDRHAVQTTLQQICWINSSCSFPLLKTVAIPIFESTPRQP